MAENKKSFMLYADQKNLFDKLPNEKAGELIKHIFKYVNDENPINEDLLIEIAFESIKQQLKRDLKKWEQRAEHSRNNGLKGGRPKNPTEPKKPSGLIDNPTEPKKPVNVNVNDNVTVNVNDNVINYKTCLLSELKNSDVENEKYLEITLAFYELFKNNLIEAGGSLTTINKAKGNWIDPIRLLIETDKQTHENLTAVYKFLQVDEFWKKNILSTATLRKQFNKLLMNIKNNGTAKGHNKKNGTSISEIGAILSKHFD